MKKLILNRKIYADKVYACWLGKNIGGTLGAPYECSTYVNDLDFYRPVPSEPIPNDDLDLQLVWLQMLEDKGTEFSLTDFADYWKKHLSPYPWNEYGFCSRNLKRGLMPPVSGWFENYYVDEMGSPIRSEIWGCLVPAAPQQAAAFAWLDSAMDHAGGEGTWGEMFWAAVESAAFVISDPLKLIHIGLNMIPPSCNISRVIRYAVWCWENQISWAEARDRIITTFYNKQPCNAIPNHGFTIIGWLYGRDFGDKLCRAVNCGYDTDCTGATLGSVLGIIGGTEGIPAKWIEPVGKSIVLHKFTENLNAPANIDELAIRMQALAECFAEANITEVGFGEQTKLSDDLWSYLNRNELAREAINKDIRCGIIKDKNCEISFNYGGDPTLFPSEEREIRVSASIAGKPLEITSIELSSTSNWTFKPLEATGVFLVKAADSITDNEIITVKLSASGQSYSGEFTVLSPAEAKGFPCATQAASANS